MCADFFAYTKAGRNVNLVISILCSRNSKTFEIRPIRATFSCFAGSKVMFFHSSMKNMTF